MTQPTATQRSYSKRALFDLLGYEPHPGQVQVHRSTAPRRIIACGARWGKTVAAAMEAVAALLAPAERTTGWVVAPNYDLADRVFREIELVVLKHLRHRLIALKENERRILIRNMAGGVSEVRAKSADNPVSLLGEGLDLVIVDEAARMKPTIWQSHLSQRLIDKRGWALLISTPRGKGYFYDLYRRGQGGDPDYESWNMPSWKNPMLDSALIEQERSRVPERIFREQFGAEFLEGSGSVFRNVRECATGNWQEPKKGEIYFAGLDLARVNDFTVLAIFSKDRELVFVDRFTGVDWSIQVERIKAACARYNDAWVTVDSTGAGEPVFESLRTAGIRVEPYVFSQRSKDALIRNLAMLLESRKLTLPRPELWPVGIEELEAMEYTISEAGHVSTGAPHGFHDDCAVAVALGAWQLSKDHGPPRILSIPRGSGWH